MPLNKLDIIQLVKPLNLPTDQYSLLMGAALVFHGVKEFANDIDLGCSNELFVSMLEKGYEVSLSRSGYEKVIVGNKISFYKEWLPLKKILIDDIPVADLASVIADKKRFNRPKDINDIVLIGEFIKCKEMFYD